MASGSAASGGMRERASSQPVPAPMSVSVTSRLQIQPAHDAAQRPYHARQGNGKERVNEEIYSADAPHEPDHAFYHASVLHASSAGVVRGIARPVAFTRQSQSP